MSNMFFGFGHGFGGTQLLSKVLNLVSGVDCDHERRDKISPSALFEKYKGVWYGQSDGEQFIRDQRIHMVKRVIDSGNIFGEVNGILGFFVTPLHKVWPNAKFIYMYRDPRKQIISAHNTGVFCHEAFPDNFDPFWWPYPYPNWEIKNEWDDMSNLERCAWFWSDYNEFVMKQIKDIPEEQVFYWKFEDMVKGKNLDKVCDFLNISMPSDTAALNRLLNTKVGKTAKRATVIHPPWAQLNHGLKVKCLKYMKPTMDKLGY